MGRCREGAVVLAGGEVVKVSNDKDIQLSGQGGNGCFPVRGTPKWIVYNGKPY